MAINTYFKNIADAIREKTGGSAFITPGQMPEEIRDIQGGGALPVEPYSVNVKDRYIAGSSWIYNGDNSNNSYVYKIDNADTYYIFCGDTVGNAFRVGYSTFDPTSSTGTQSITLLIDTIANPYNVYKVTIPANNYLIVYKGYQNSETPVVYLYDKNSFTLN